MDHDVEDIQTVWRPVLEKLADGANKRRLASDGIGLPRGLSCILHRLLLERSFSHCWHQTLDPASDHHKYFMDTLKQPRKIHLTMNTTS